MSQKTLAFDTFVDQLATETRTEWHRFQGAQRARRQHSWAGG